MILTKKRMKVAQMIEQQTLAVHSLFYQGKRYSKEELEEILAAYYKRINKAGRNPSNLVKRTFFDHSAFRVTYRVLNDECGGIDLFYFEH